MQTFRINTSESPLAGKGGRQLPAIILSMVVLSGINARAEITLPAGDKTGSELGIEIRNVTRTDGMLDVVLGLDVSSVNMKSNLETVYQPMYVNGSDTLRFAPFAVAGRNRWYSWQRNGQDCPMVFRGFGSPEKRYDDVNLAGTFNEDGKTTWSVAGKKGESQAYRLELTTPYADWMENATLVFDARNIGCANCNKGPEGLGEYPVAQNDFSPRTYSPELIYVTPVAETVKTRELSARAYVDFPVNKIVIYPDYRRNTIELGKIVATIDSIKNDPDITVTSLHIAGTASPEGPYSNNVYLAKNRTIALKDYVQNLYKFAPGFITTSYEPVDWAGLSEWLENNNLENREAILAIVKGDLPPEQRNSKIQTTYPVQYKWLLEQVYPALRHSDYIIRFEIKKFTNPEEIIQIMLSQPQKLSLNELFVAANSQPVGSELYNRAFEIAVTMYPNDATANLNAGINALSRGDLAHAERYLNKAGDNAEAQFNRAMLKYRQGSTEEAMAMLLQLSRGSGDVAKKAKTALESIQELNKIKDKNFKLL